MDCSAVIPIWAVIRWQRQMHTPYSELPEQEKESDRKEADEILKIVQSPNKPLNPWQKSAEHQDLDKCYPLCDFCKSYDSNLDRKGCYVKLGYCNFHKKQIDPDKECDDFVCRHGCQ